jgi:hypothetical protein
MTGLWQVEERQYTSFDSYISLGDLIVCFNAFWSRVSPVFYLLQGQPYDFLLCH